MKRNTLLLVLTILVFSFGNSTVRAAGNTGQSTAAGAVGGALVGQAIGRNTEGTLIGATLGGFIGYIVGNEMDKSGDRRYTQHAPVVKHVYVTPPERLPVEVIIHQTYGHGYRNSPKYWRGPRHRGYNNHRRYNRHRHYKKHRYSRGHRGHRGYRDNYNIVIW